MIKIKIQSISDVITNSSTEVFIVYDSSNIDSIKHIIDAILSIDGHYTFDDLFTIKMNPSEYAIEDLYKNWEYFFPKDPKPESLKEFDEFINSLPQEELDRYVNIWESSQTYYWESYPFYEGKDEVLQVECCVLALRAHHLFPPALKRWHQRGSVAE